MPKDTNALVALTRLGLVEGEIKIYSTLLEGGELEVATIIERSKLKKGDCYNKLYRLHELGLIEEVKKGKIQRYRLADPRFLEDVANRQFEAAAQAKRELEITLPSLISQFTLHTNKPSVRSAEGIEGLKGMYDELNSSGTDTLLLMRSTFDNKPAIDEIVQAQIAKQVKLGIHTKALTPWRKKMVQSYSSVDASRFTERRIVNPEAFQLEAQILIWSDTVAMVSLQGDLVTTILTNPSISQTMRCLFETIWNASASFHQSIVESWSEGSGS